MTDSGREVLRSLGLDALVEILETTAYGVCITGDDHRWVYVNPAGARILGRPFEEIRGRDYLLHFAEHEREVLMRLEAEQRQGDTEFYTNTIVQPDGTERLMTWSGTVVEVDGNELAPAIFHETTPVHRARRTAAELAASEHAGALDSLVQEALRGSRAAAAVLLLEHSSGELWVAASAGAAPGLPVQVAQSRALLSDLPGTDDLARGRSVFLSDGSVRFAGNPRTATWVAGLAEDDWSGAVHFGIRCDGRTTGCLVVLLPSSLTSPSEAEVAHWSSMADQIGVVVGAELIREHVSAHSALTERSRIARDLHDSVSQALFSLHARAQVIRRAFAVDDRDLALEAAEDLELLARRATAELRELLGELRPSADGCDLGATLRDLAAEVTRLDGLPVEVAFSPATLPPLPAELGQHVHRIVREALHNTVKHAGADSASVCATVDRDRLTVEVRDDGRGFDVGVAGDGFGQHTMRERARLCGGRLRVVSSPGAGTTVALDVPLDRGARRAAPVRVRVGQLSSSYTESKR